LATPNKYTAGAFEGYAKEDIEGLIKDRLREARKYLDLTLEELDDLCGGVQASLNTAVLSEKPTYNISTFNPLLNNLTNSSSISSLFGEANTV
jgi:hypothetical protein